MIETLTGAGVEVTVPAPRYPQQIASTVGHELQMVHGCFGGHQLAFIQPDGSVWGRAGDTARLRRFADDRSLAVVADACQALGSTIDGVQVGVEATIGCFSTQELKLLSTSEGGFLTTRDDDFADRARAYRSHWLSPPSGQRPLSRLAHNFRLAEPLAAIGRRELARIDALIQQRVDQTILLLDLLADLPQVRPADVPAGQRWNHYAPLLHLQLDRSREFSERLSDQGVPNSTGSFRLIPLDQHQTGITPDMLADRPCAGDVLAELDRRVTAGPYMLVAHHAPAEARLLFDYREHCPHLARIDLLDTVRLARDLYPELPKHGLDDLLRHLQIPSPPHRHRAMADVQVTTDLFIRLVTTSDWVDLRQLRGLAGYAARTARPEQVALFG